MAFRISPLWWPVMTAASPVLVPMLLRKNGRFKKNLTRANELNQERIERAEPLELPKLDFLELTVLVEEKTQEGFLGDAGVSYLFRTDQGSLLYDVGFGPTRPAMAHNAAKLGFTLDQVDALAISHLHCDHMGGIPAQRSKQVTVPEEMGLPGGKTCFLPDEAKAEGFTTELVKEPRLLTAGIASTGPLARSLFILGWTEEQALLARVRDKGVVVFTGCGHPTIEIILKMVRRLSNEPLYAIGGGLHFPVTCGRGNRAGIQFQMLIGTGLPPWRQISDDELSSTIASINEAAPKHVYLSAHDTCDHSLKRFENEVNAETQVLRAGAKYHL